MGPDLPGLRDIERAAGAMFREIGMPEIADDEPLPLETLAGYAARGRAWVVVGEPETPLAYLLAEDLDGCVHIAQVSVDPAWARRRLGRRLLDHVAAEAATIGVPALTLTTFRDVPWNAPYYHRCGFRVLTESEVTPGLRAVRRQEAEQGLDRWPRVCMRRDLEPGR